MRTGLNGQHHQQQQQQQQQQHQLIKCRKKVKFYLIKIHAFNGQKLVKTSLHGRKLALIRKQLKSNQAKNVVSARNEVKSRSNKNVSSIISSATLLPSSSSLTRTLSPLKYSLSSSTSSLSSSSSLLQTLPSPTDEFKSWPSSSSSSTADVVDIDGAQEDNKKPSINNVEKDSIDEDKLREERFRRNLEILTGVSTILITTTTTEVSETAAAVASTAAATTITTTTGYSSSNNNSNNNLSNDQRKSPSAGRLSSDSNSRALLWQNHHHQQQPQPQPQQLQQQQPQPQFRPQSIEEDRRRQIQSLSITLRRPTFEANSNTTNANNISNISNITHNATVHLNNNVGYIFNGVGTGLGIKRPLVQDDPSEPEPTSKENIKRIKVANGYQNVAVLDDRYLFIRKIEGTTFYYCIDAKARKKLMCKVSLDPCTKLIEAHAKLNGHPCISQLLKVIRKENKTYMFFPMPQDDLLSYVRRRKRLPERDARFLFLQMCAIVKSCHNQGIVLRDLKLRKFVFSDNFRKHLKLESLVDAVVLDDPTNDLLKEKRGCPVYVAPEILKATQTYCGKAADMWSLGVILYTMLIGRYPFSDTEHAGLFAKISRGQFTLPDVITPKARCLIRCLLRQEPEERITSEDIFYHPWMSFSDATEINLSNTDQCVPSNDFIDVGEKIIGNTRRS